MVKCDYCGEEIEGLPYKCKYCGGTFCVWHHLPENHRCAGLRLAVSTSLLERGELRPARSLEGMNAHRLRTPLGVVELANLALGTLAVVFAWAYPLSTYSLTAAALVALAAYLPHELAHKVAAERYGCSARYVISPWGLLLTLLSALLPLRIILPGYVLIETCFVGAREEGVISAAGPATNIVIGSLALALGRSRLAWDLACASAVIALFNLIPLGGLDGRKIMKWNPVAWAIMLAAALALLVLTL